MTTNIIALSLVALVCILVPVVVFVVVLLKSRDNKKRIFLSFISGVSISLLFEWIIKEQMLKFLFNHANLQQFVNSHYLLYVFLVALLGSLLAVIPEYAVISYAFKRKMSYSGAAMFGLGFAMAEAVTLMGYQSISTIVELVKNPETSLNTTTKELFLSSYERLLVMIIHVAVVIILVYFIENAMSLRGCLVAIFCLMIESFIPGFIIAFTTREFLELYTRDVALLIIYVFLTVMALSGVVISRFLRDSIRD